MKTSRLSMPDGRVSQAIALSIPVGLLVSIYLGVLAPGVQWYDAREDQLVIGQSEVSHILGMARSVPFLQKKLDSLKAESDGSQMLLSGTSDEVASANLQSAIKVVADQTNTNIDSMSSLPVQYLGGLHQIAIQLSLTTRWPQLLELISSIDLARPRMIISNLSITGAAQPEESNQDQVLQLSFTITAFRTSNGA